MGVPYSLLNQYRIYDEAMRDLLSQFLVDYGTISGERKSRHPILIIMSSPERAFAKMYQVLTRRGWVAGLTPEQILDDAQLYKTVPLPFLSIQRRDASLDFGRSNAPFIFKRFEKFDDGTSVDHPHPVPYDYNYDLTLWCKKQYTAIYFQEWIQSLIGDRGAAPQELFKYINLGVWGNQLHGIRFESVFETSKNTGMLYGFRDYTYMASLILKGWMFKRPDYENRSSIVLQQKVRFEEQSSTLPIEQHELYISSVTKNLIESVSPVYYPPVVFETSDAAVVISQESSDGRYDSYTPYVPGTPPAFKMEFNDVGATVRTKPLRIHPYQTTVAVRYTIKRETGSATFRLLDKEKNIVRQIDILPTAGWQRPQEIFIKLDRVVYLEWQADSDDLYIDILAAFIREGYRGTVELLQDSDMSDPGTSDWTALGGAALSKVMVGGDQTLRVGTTAFGDGVSQSTTISRMGLYILTVDVKEATVDYLLTFTNGTESDTILIKPGLDTKLGLVIFTTQNLEVKIEQNAGNGFIILDNIQIRSFRGAPLLQV